MRIIVFSETTDRTATPGASTSPRAATAASAKTSETTTATHNNRATSSSVYAVDGTIFFLCIPATLTAVYIFGQTFRETSRFPDHLLPHIHKGFLSTTGTMPSDDTLSMR